MVPSPLYARFVNGRSWVIERARGETLTLSLAAVVGVGTGVLAAALIEVIRWTQAFAWGDGPLGPLRLLAIPTLGALAVGFLIATVAPESAGSGIVQTMRTLALRGGWFRSRVPVLGIGASGIAIGTGAAGGREGPIVLIGGSLGSLLGRLFALDDDQLRTLVAAGAAAGIAASFNAPIGGMLFATELLLGGRWTRSLQSLVVASVAGAVTARHLIGPDIIYRPRVEYVLSDPRELVLYALLGLAAVAVGLGFLYGVDRAGAMFARLPVAFPVRLGLGGLGVGLLAMWIPEVLGTGDGLPPIDGVRSPIQGMLDSTIGDGWSGAGLLLVLAAAKLTATCLSIGSGNAVGAFAPVIFVGAALGGAVGHAANELVPTVAVEPGALALVGMAAAFGAAARAPLTAIVIVSEITGDYALVLPLMLATGLATVIADRLHPESIYTLPLRRDGIAYAEPEDVDIMETVLVGEVMVRDPMTVTVSTPVEVLRETFARTGAHGCPVLDGDRLVGMVARSDLARAEEGPPGRGRTKDPLTAGDICTRDPATVVAHDPVSRGVRRMAALDVGRLPVVSPEDHHHLVGLLRRSDLVSAYQQAVERTVSAQLRRHAAPVRDLVGIDFLEAMIDAGSAAGGRLIREIDWPGRSVVTSIRRDGQVILPHGETRLQAGDEVTVLAPLDASERLRELFGADAEG